MASGAEGRVKHSFAPFEIAVYEPFFGCCQRFVNGPGATRSFYGREICKGIGLRFEIPAFDKLTFFGRCTIECLFAQIGNEAAITAAYAFFRSFSEPGEKLSALSDRPRSVKSSEAIGVKEILLGGHVLNHCLENGTVFFIPECEIGPLRSFAFVMGSHQTQGFC